uniref:Uncharacterized protein n=1 Tax=Cacopsylla melanoneura TaxID=428564 RepID=A0A8D8Z9Z0_9HEMI
MQTIYKIFITEYHKYSFRVVFKKKYVNVNNQYYNIPSPFQGIPPFKLNDHLLKVYIFCWYQVWAFKIFILSQEYISARHTPSCIDKTLTRIRCVISNSYKLEIFHCLQTELTKVLSNWGLYNKIDTMT